MFKYRVLTFTIILSMLLFYTTPIGSIEVKANEITYTQRQLQDVGAWFIGERLLEGAVENFNFDNLPTDLTADDFLADLGAIVVDGNPDPLLDHLGKAADDIWNGIEQEIANWTSDDAWSLVKDFFYTLWYDANPPQYSPIIDVLRISDGINEQLGVYDKLLQYANTDIPNVNPDENYLNYIDTINGNGFYWKNYGNFNDGNPNQAGLVYYPPSSTSWFSRSFIPYSYQYIIYAFTTPIKDVNIFSQNGVYQFSITFSDILNNFIWEEPYYYSSGYITNSSFGYSGNAYTNPISHSGTLVSCLENLSYYCRNINIYVDGVPWSIVNVTPEYPIASTDLTYLNYEPAKYNYPSGTSVDWNRLYSIIYNAVHDGIVLDFGDLEDCFVDVNGQTAVATLGLVRNDYDNLVQEQFTIVPYPRFNNNLWLTNLAEEMTEPAQNGVTIIENAYNIFPLPLQKALLFAGALLLFGLLIRRFLE